MKGGYTKAIAGNCDTGSTEARQLRSQGGNHAILLCLE